MRVSSALLTGLALLCAVAAQAQQAADPFLHKLYDKLHDSPEQQRIRTLAPVPVGVVFLPWAGITEPEIREQFRTMRRLGFRNLKQVMGTPEWPEQRLLEIALEEDIIPFWYGEAGWKPLDAARRQLGLSAELTPAQLRSHPAVVAYQKTVLSSQIAGVTGGTTILDAGADAPGAFRHTPDPLVRDTDIPHFRQWLRRAYSTPAALARAWNEFEVGIATSPVRTWEDVDRLVAEMATQANTLRGAGGEYGRVRDVLRYKAETHAAAIEKRAREFRRQFPAAPTRTGGEMGLFLPFAWRATNMELLARTQLHTGSFYPSIHFAWHYGEVNYEVARPLYMQAAFATDLFKGGWVGGWESTGGPQQLTGGKGWDYPEQSTTAGFTVNSGTITQMLLSFFAAGFKGAGLWTWNYRAAGWEGGEFALLNRQLRPTDRAIRAGKIAQAADRYRDELWSAHKEPLVGVLLNWDSDAIWAAISMRGRDHFRHYPMKARVGISRALINGNVPFEYVTVSDLEAGLAPRYKVLYLGAQIALTDSLLRRLRAYVEAGGQVVMDSPGGMYDETGRVLNTAAGSAFEQLFGAEAADFQYSSNVPRAVAGRGVNGFVTELHPTTATTSSRFDTGEPAVVINNLGKGRATLLAWDASFELFAPGVTQAEARLRAAILGPTILPYRSEAIVYRLAAPEADHYFLINDGPARSVRLETPGYRYRAASDALTGQPLALTGPIALEAHSGRWLRFAF